MTNPSTDRLTALLRHHGFLEAAAKLDTWGWPAHRLEACVLAWEGFHPADRLSATRLEAGR
jgi:hypothetical protein